MPLSFAQIQQFKIDGYLILPAVLTEHEADSLRATTQAHLNNRVRPFELEADLHYPGAPSSIEAEGGGTIRRLLMAYQRDDAFKSLAAHPEITHAVKKILDSQDCILNLNHHNCIMTKQAAYSSETLWHRDTRYWNFNN